MRLGKGPAIIAWLAVVLGTTCITQQYRHDGQTFDEAAHLACGMEWLTRGSYHYEALHPPLARAATAVGPALVGDRAQGHPSMLVEGNALLQFGGKYWRNLTLARLGILPFFWLACWLVYGFASRHLGGRRQGAWIGAVAVTALALCPPVLAHSALATTDAALMAMFAWSLMRWGRLVERPSLPNALWAGLALGLALLTKFTELPFFGLAALGVLLLATVRRQALAVPVRLLLVVALVVPPVVWAGYRFSVGPVLTPASMNAGTEAKVQALPSTERKLLTQTPVPADEFFRGLLMARGTGAVGRMAYLMGQPYTGGRRLFFPVAVLVKTPLPTLGLMAVGLGCLLVLPRLRGQPAMWLVLLGAASPMLVAMAGQVNIGLRHVLPSYPFFALLAGVGAMELWGVAGERWLLARRLLGVALIGWMLGAAATAGPDYIPYFNEAAAPHRSYWLANSDLDWGESLPELADELRRRGAQSVTIGYYGDPEASLAALPRPALLQPGARPHGWVAVSESAYEQFPQYLGWLAPYPYTEVDGTFRLYRLP